MQSSQFTQEVIAELNSFRDNPSFIIKKCEKLRTALSRFNKNDPFLKEVDMFLGTCKSAPRVGKLVVNEKLSSVAEIQLGRFVNEEMSEKYLDGKTVELMLNEVVTGFSSAYLLIDDGAEGPTDVIPKILLNKADKQKKGRNVFMDTSVTHIGIAHQVKDDENVVVMIITDGAEDIKKKEIALPEGDLTELKQAFDFYDINGLEKISPKETLNAMKALGFDVKHPNLYDIMTELDTPQYNKTLVDWETFANHFYSRIQPNNEKGIKDIFSLYLDDPSETEINMHSLKRICQDLGEYATEKELREMLRKCGRYDSKVSFDQFYDFMTQP